jgi:PAS domain S-box-containing protein
MKQDSVATVHDHASDGAEQSIAEVLVEQSSDALIALSPEGTVQFWSTGAERIFGYPRRAALGRSLDDLIVPTERRAEARAALAEVVRAGSTLLETVRLREDGSRVDVDIAMRAIRGADGALRFVAVDHTDVSTLARLRVARAAETRFRGLLEAAPDAMVIVGDRGRIVLVNGQTETLFGYARDELLGQPVEILVPERFRADHPAHRNGYFRDAAPRPMGGGLDLFCRRKNGSEFPAEISLSPMDSEEGRVVIAAIRDISERKKAEEKFRALLESAPDAMVIVDARGRIALVNAQTETLFGYTRQELLGRSVEVLIPERFGGSGASERSGYFSRPVASAMGSLLDLWGLKKDGTEFPIEMSLAPLDTQDGLLVSSAIRDMTERRAIETALKAANHELEAFSYSVAHDLRAPLRGMNGFAQLLLDGYHDQLDPEAQDWLVEILSNARRMGALIDALLALSRVTRIELKREWIDLTAIARASAEQIAASDLPHAAVDITVADGLCAVADPHLARTVIDNLLGNAWKFTSRAQHARIEVGATENAEQRTFFVRDNGAGFDMQFADKLFVPFQRLHTVSEFPGTGIGLASVQRIVHRHGGRIWAEGRIGEGATFYFTFHGSSPGVEP